MIGIIFVGWMKWKTTKPMAETIRTETTVERWKRLEREKEIGKIKAWLKDNFGNGFLKIDAKIYHVIDKKEFEYINHEVIKELAKYLDETENYIRERIEYMGERGVFESSDKLYDTDNL